MSPTFQALHGLADQGLVEQHACDDGALRWRLTDAGRAHQAETRFDVGCDPGPIEESYAPSDAMTDLIQAIADLDDLPFRFWCAMTLGVNLHSVTPLSHAEEVVMHVVGGALDEDGPTDDGYGLVLNADGEFIGVDRSGDLYEPDDFERLVFAVITLPCAVARGLALHQFALHQFALHQALSKPDEDLVLAVRLFGDWLQARAIATTH